MSVEEMMEGLKAQIRGLAARVDELTMACQRAGQSPCIVAGTPVERVPEMLAARVAKLEAGKSDWVKLGSDAAWSQAEEKMAAIAARHADVVRDRAEIALRRISELQALVDAATLRLNKLADASEAFIDFHNGPPGCRNWVKEECALARDLAAKEKEPTR